MEDVTEDSGEVVAEEGSDDGDELLVGAYSYEQGVPYEVENRE